MSDNQSNNKRIAKNTIMLYVRMLLSIMVTLYTSRVVLQTLGVDDFGTYGVVGGIVAMFASLNASMSGATSRFITYAIGKGDADDVRDTFSTSLIIHISIALIVILLCETVGLWFLENKLVIPEERMDAARFVFQFSVLSMAVTITQVPYNASIISYERMDVYAYVELLNVVLKLLIVYLLQIGNFDKLKLYAILVFCVSCSIAMIYRFYCVHNFKTCHFKFVWNKKKLIPMLGFSGWDLYGNLSVASRQQGTNMLINMFFGVAYNAAGSVAASVQGTLSSLSGNVIQAFRPQIIKSYAQDNIVRMETLMSNAIKLTTLLFFMTAVPIFFEMDYVMHLWLGEVPSMAVEFCRLLLVYGYVCIISNILCIGIHATGNIKLLSFVTGTIYLLSLPANYGVFVLFPDNPLWAYYISIGMMIVVVASNIAIIKRVLPSFSSVSYLKGTIAGVMIGSISSIPIICISLNCAQSLIRFILVIVIYILTCGVLTFYIGLSKNQQRKIKQIIQSKLHSKD